jgi:hypothetical protein
MLALVLLLCSTPAAHSAPCLAQSLNAYLALGPGGCSVGGISFTDFSLLDVLAPGATPVDPGAVSVAPVSSAAGSGFALSFGPTAPLSAGAGELLSLRLGFNAAAAALPGAFGALLEPIAAGDAAITLVEDLCLGAPFDDPHNLLCSASVTNLVAIAIEGFSDNPVSMALDPAGVIGVAADITVDGGPTGSASLAGAELRFVVDAVAVPAPSSLALLGIALCAFAARGRAPKQ